MEHNLLLFIYASLRVGMPNCGIEQPGVCGIMKSQVSTLTGLLALESLGSQILNLNLLISTDSSVIVYLNKQGGTHSQKCAPLSEGSYLGPMPGGSDSGRSHPRESKCSSRFLVHKRQDDSN